jgi:hypothetical protein
MPKAIDKPSSSNATSRDPELVIFARPQISVIQSDFDEIEISTTRIGPDFKQVLHETVIIPLADARQVGETILAICQHRGA